jgi:hypothetical protein
MQSKGVYIGIDPGKRGAAALWDTRGEIKIHDFVSFQIAVDKLRDWTFSHEIDLVALEVPQFHPKDGKISIRELNRNLGVWEGALLAFDLPYIPVSSSAWKRIIPPMTIKNPKRKAIAYCRQMFPGCESLISKAKDHDRAEAILLAYYARDYDRFSPKGIK